MKQEKGNPTDLRDDPMYGAERKRKPTGEWPGRVFK